MKLHFPKQAPKMSYRYHKKFRSEIFRAELDNEFYELDAWGTSIGYIGYQHRVPTFFKMPFWRF